MAQVTVVLNGRSYQFGCEPGEETRLRELGRHVQARVEDVGKQYGKVGNDRILAMAALLIADDLLEAKERLGERRPGGMPVAQSKPQAQAKPPVPPVAPPSGAAAAPLAKPQPAAAATGHGKVAADATFSDDGPR